MAYGGDSKFLSVCKMIVTGTNDSLSSKIDGKHFLSLFFISQMCQNEIELISFSFQFDQVICGNRNKGTVTRTTDFGRSPMSDIFGGKLRSRVHREGDHATDNIQPFFTLQLDIEVSVFVIIGKAEHRLLV